MVNSELIEAARKLPARRILVTGGSGFVGSHLAIAFTAAGHDVIACGRNPYRVPFAANGPKFQRADLTDSVRMAELSKNCDLVYHCGALASLWGSPETFSEINVQGTQNVVSACLDNGVPRLVHVSSTAVHFDFLDQDQITESAPFAQPFACDYARSKAEAEIVVHNGIAAGLNAVIVRARAVFGEGDNSLLPRLLEAADHKRLRQIGSANTRIDMTYIDNVVFALILAADAGDSGSTYTITNRQPVSLWPFIKQVLKQTGRSDKLRSVSRPIALKFAGMMEWWYRWRGKTSEPPATRYSVGLLSTTKTFDISAAEQDLGYKPIMAMHESTQRTTDSLLHKEDSESETHVRVQLFTTGYTSAKSHHAERGASRNKTIRFHALIAVIDHPVHGLTLFDTGYSPRFFEATRRMPYRLYQAATPVITDQQLSAVEMLRANGIDPNRIRRIVLSHFHADHTCGLIDFPNADIIATRRCWDAVRSRKGIGAVKRAFVPDLIPPDIKDRLFLIEQFHGPGIGNFPNCHDLFADGSVRMLDLSGHAPGQIGLLLQRGPKDRALLAADSVWTSRIFRDNLKPTLPFRLLADSVAEVKVSQQRLHDLSQQYPDIEIIPTHCPEVADRYGFDKAVDSIISKESRGTAGL